MATEFNHARRELLVGATDAARYPHLDAADLAALSALAEPCSFKDGEAIFHAGQCDLDLTVGVIGPSHFAGAGRDALPREPP